MTWMWPTDPHSWKDNRILTFQPFQVAFYSKVLLAHQAFVDSAFNIAILGITVIYSDATLTLGNRVLNEG